MPTLRTSTASPPTHNSIHLVVDGLTYPAGTYYAMNLYSGVSPNGTLIGSMASSGGGSSPNYYSSAYGVFGLNPNTSYSFYVNIKYQSASQTTTVSGTWSTTSPPPPTDDYTDTSWGINNPRIYAYGSGSPAVSGNIEVGTDKDYFKFIPTKTGTHTFYSTGAIADNYGTLYSSSGSIVASDDDSNGSGKFRFNASLTAGQNYYLEVRPYNTSYTGSYQIYIIEPIVLPEPIVLSISNIGGQSFIANFSGGMYSTNIALEVFEGTSEAGTKVFSKYDIATGVGQYSVSGLKELTNYYVKCYGRNSDGNGTPDYEQTQTKDITNPVVTITNSDGAGRVWFDFNGNDSTPQYGGNMSGLSHYLVWISTPNGGQASLTSYFTVTDLGLSYYTFTTDRDGNNFQNGAVYTLGVRAVDVAGNWSDLKIVAVTYTRVRPNNWTNWTGSGQKVSGTAFSVTATEWESLGKAINQFRTYKGLITRDFTIPTAGQSFTAGIFNQYVNALNDMNPPTAPPTSKVKGDVMYASDFNKLANSLNSIP